jgi:hypothetical protein
MSVTVDQSKLVLNAFAAIFQNNLVSKDLVTWKKFDGEMNDRNGLEVVEQITPDYTTTFTTSGVADLTGGVQDSIFGSERYKLDQTIGSSMGWSDFVKIRDIGEARESQALRKASLRLATDIDTYIMSFVTNAANNWLGDGTSNVSEWEDVASAYTRLKDEGVEDTGLRAVMSYHDKQALGTVIVEDNASMPDLADGVYRNGFTGSVAGIPTMFTQTLPAFTVGTRVAAATSVTNYSSGSPDNDYADVAISPAPGQYMTGVLNFDGQSGAVTVKEGEVFTIAGIYAYDNRTKKRLAHLQQFRVVGGTGGDGINAGTYTASSGAFTAVRYFPAIITSGPHKTVENTNGGGATWDGLAITHLGTASTTLYPRVIANKDSVIVNTADLILPASGRGSRKALTQVPMSVRMWEDSVFATGEHRVRFDVAIKANVVDRRRGARFNGA